MPTKTENELNLTAGQVTYKPPEDVTFTAEQLRESVETVNQLIRETTEMINRIASKAWECYVWSKTNRPRLAHLAHRSKKARVRRKNARRIIREFLKEDMA